MRHNQTFRSAQASFGYIDVVRDIAGHSNTSDHEEDWKGQWSSRLTISLIGATTKPECR